MSKPVAKKKRKRSAEIAEVFDAKAQRKAEKLVRNHIMTLDELSEERDSYAQTILKENDASVRDITDRITESLKRMQPIHADIVLTVQGQRFRPTPEEVSLLKNIQERNFRYIAVRILVACAEWNIRVGDFKLPKHNCSLCGKKVK